MSARGATIVSFLITLGSLAFVFGVLSFVEFPNPLAKEAASPAADASDIKARAAAAAQYYDSAVATLATILFGLYIAFGLFFREFSTKSNKMEIFPVVFVGIFFVAGIAAIVFLYRAKVALVVHVANGGMNFDGMMAILSYLALATTIAGISLGSAVAYQVIRHE